ncbi:hypothetical protein [Deinococcus arenicola]|uniref:Uncharacterized protein n=1 Tax=Deinococcus arenicola TaxID=2994950 RepID=A0ABU4DRJ9_9DEIO|nr:hypothetical protein [Deinococcus sp. ZS9-10]MDV6375055.1 hypothetical protein [Deinococcus sp. ZS9-10]
MTPWLVALWIVAGLLQLLIAFVPIMLFAADSTTLLFYLLAVFSLPLLVFLCQGTAVTLVRRGRVKAGLWFAFGPLPIGIVLMPLLLGFFF